MFSTAFGVSVAIGRSILERRRSPRRSVDKYDDDDDDDDEEEEEEAMSSASANSNSASTLSSSINSSLVSTFGTMKPST
jgi:hypothetical protein